MDWPINVALNGWVAARGPYIDQFIADLAGVSTTHLLLVLKLFIQRDVFSKGESISSMLGKLVQKRV